MDPIYMFMGPTLGVSLGGKQRGLLLYLLLLPVPHSVASLSSASAAAYGQLAVLVLLFIQE